jgi:membrane-associated protein
MRIPRILQIAKVALLLYILLGLFVPPALADAPPSATATVDTSDSFFMQVLKNLLNSKGLMDVLAQPQYKYAAYVTLIAIVFTETGLLIGFFLPGDSLLVTVGLICAGNPQWDFWPLMAVLCAAAVIGDSVGYSIGYRTGPRIFNRENSWFFHKDHLLKAQEFYVKHGGKTIILARFMPILRTFAPVVAGIGKMEYRKFLFYNVFGGIGWVAGMMLIGYLLPTALNPVLQPLFGEHFLVEEHVEKIIILVVLLSIAPGIYVWLRSKFQQKPVEIPLVSEPVAVEAK